MKYLSFLLIGIFTLFNVNAYAFQESPFKWPSAATSMRGHFTASDTDSPQAPAGIAHSLKQGAVGIARALPLPSARLAMKLSTPVQSMATKPFFTPIFVEPHSVHLPSRSHSRAFLPPCRQPQQAQRLKVTLYSTQQKTGMCMRVVVLILIFAALQCMKWGTC